MSTPTFYGTYADPATDRLWLVLEYVGESRRLRDIDDPTAMQQAARWIGRFHQRSTKCHGSGQAFLTRLDPDYYRGCVSRTARFAHPWRDEFPWIRPLCGSLETALPSLAAQPQAIVHGEFYRHNVLFQKGIVRPVDWETAAAAPGEIDLVSLTEGWPRAIARPCEIEYQRARWPNGTPRSFARTFDLARLYVHLRWLGDETEPTFGKKKTWRFREMLVISKRLGLL
jgi:aminoglycoside phosphotransferase (APT) family kinase protein